VWDEAEAENCTTVKKNVGKSVIGNFTGNRLTDNRFTTLVFLDSHISNHIDVGANWRVH